MAIATLSTTWPSLPRARLTISKALTLSNSLCYSSSLKSLGTRRRFRCLFSSSSFFGKFSGGGAGFVDSNSKLGAGAGDDVSVPSSDIIILDVGGMTCGGCSASVKKILESQPQVASASVDLTTNSAVVWPILEAKTAPDWQKTLGETLANHLTNCGFQSTPRGVGEVPEDIAP